MIAESRARREARRIFNGSEGPVSVPSGPGRTSCAYHAKKFEELNFKLKKKSKEPKAKKKKAKQKASNRGPVQPERPGPLHSGSASTKASSGLVRRHLPGY